MMAQYLKKSISLFLDLVFPKICFRCGLEGHYFCSLSRPPKPLHEYFTKPKRGWYLNGLIAVYSYENETIRQAIHAMKYNGVKEIAQVLGAELYRQVGDLINLQGVVVPVPLHSARLRRRGFNQAALIASQMPGFPVIQALERKFSTRPQIELKRSERQDNIKDAFGPSSVIDEIKKKTVFLVDDVATTGATLNACAKILKRHGAAHVFGVVLARD